MLREMPSSCSAAAGLDETKKKDAFEEDYGPGSGPPLAVPSNGGVEKIRQTSLAKSPAQTR
jgi:hypothetical protein